MNGIYWLTLLVLRYGLSADCIFDPNNKLTNCLSYCMLHYSRQPQRAYYNETSQNCQPIRKCRGSYYHYPSNKCYVSERNRTQTESYIPKDTVTVNRVPSYRKNVICVNGIIATFKNAVSVVCQCQLLWYHSGLRDMNGLQFKCDKVVRQIARYFVPNLRFDENGTITHYGGFTASQVNIIHTTLLHYQAELNKTYIRNQTDAILYAVKHYTKEQNIIRSGEEIYLAGLLIFILILFWVSYVQYKTQIVVATQSQFKLRLQMVINNKNPIQQIN